MPAATRDFLNPIIKSVPASAASVPGIFGGLLVALIAALNPVSYFTKPYIGLISWLVLMWWFWNVNPLNLIRPANTSRWNPGWWQLLKTAFWGLICNPVPMFFIYLTMLSVARIDAKLTTP